MTNCLFCQYTHMSISRVQKHQYKNMLTNYWEYSYPHSGGIFLASHSGKLPLQQIIAIKNKSSIWTDIQCSIYQPRFPYKAVGWMICCVCSEMIITLKYWCHFKANINTFTSNTVYPTVFPNVYYTICCSRATWQLS